MNDKLILILDSLKECFSLNKQSCGNYVLNTRIPCAVLDCYTCPLFQIRSPNLYPDQIITTFSQLNK
ncbi:hypothetical protein PJM40_0025 [Salmonella phage vB_SenP_UTK0002]|nr:hypothetical protein PJM40_0025 [Salmonella phage vB_SenP_UTK0002]